MTTYSYFNSAQDGLAPIHRIGSKGANTKLCGFPWRVTFALGVTTPFTRSQGSSCVHILVPSRRRDYTFYNNNGVYLRQPLLYIVGPNGGALRDMAVRLTLYTFRDDSH